jgi:hypothetical protein
MVTHLLGYILSTMGATILLVWPVLNRTLHEA